mmetsp:Transcript_26838/g.39747  ORF Transcript_26838/g.39747 Transcript_26838/m.39747 type:complete len:112 (+) Transcript_26838:73-408(+)
MFSSIITNCIILTLVLVSCHAESRSSFDNFVMSYGDFERCSFGLCRHEEKSGAVKTQPHSVHAIKKATGGGQRKRKTSKHFAQVHQERNPCDSSPSLLCGSRDHPYGWGMF